MENIRNLSRRMLIGGSVGLAIGVICGAFGFVQEVPSERYIFAGFPISMTVCAIVAELSQRHTVWRVIVCGGVIMGLFAVVMGPRDGWLVIGILLFGGSGATFGGITAIVVRAVPSGRKAK